MACLSLAFWEAIAVWVIVIIAVVALLRLLISALSGGNITFWPPATSPWASGAPSPTGLLGFVAAALNIVIWAILMIAVIYLIFALLSCLVGSIGGLPRIPR